MGRGNGLWWGESLPQFARRITVCLKREWGETQHALGQTGLGREPAREPNRTGPGGNEPWEGTGGLSVPGEAYGAACRAEGSCCELSSRAWRDPAGLAGSGLEICKVGRERVETPDFRLTAEFPGVEG